ncbi:hypothetical protein [Pseudomonas sp. 10S4]|uniref:hypothetical protein n=1 Tax=Pseudomonas sp. 10S4 TaxID=3048583 RepID=UPI002AC94B59|nr:MULTISPECIES: hypothetical protein [unclassified Pseudomonas]MEB0228080.1 hypothetical protein [Pseudomonas sp. 5S1]MEB0296668.1 hypothetical protein [Pseudomonas sp. 10S4]WPX20159.1 hypothetical protein RHM58_09595 [Pseudomonas sp. 10S4]
MPQRPVEFFRKFSGFHGREAALLGAASAKIFMKIRRNESVAEHKYVTHAEARVDLLFVGTE